MPDVRAFGMGVHFALEYLSDAMLGERWTMQATPFDIESLLAAQQADFDIMHMTRELEELPQRAIILGCRQKRDAMEAKVSKIATLKKETERKRTRITDEDASLQKKEAGVQAAIEAAGGDYRNVEARTKELDGIFRRRQTLAEQIEQLDAEMGKISDLAAQAAGALRDIDRTEEEATASFKQEGGRLKASIADAERRREELLSGVTDELARAYRTTSDHLGTVVIGRLDDGRCGVCRAAIDPGRQIELRSQAPITFCPICKRLMIVE